MTIQPDAVQPKPQYLDPPEGEQQDAEQQRGLRAWLRATQSFVTRTLLLFLTLLVLGGGAPSAQTLFTAQMRSATSNWGFDLLGWEVNALREKAGAWLDSPISHLDEPAQSQIVIDYLARARTIGELEYLLEGFAAGTLSEATAGTTYAEVATQIEELRALQSEQRALAEASIERQVTTVLQEMGFGLFGRVMPPVAFTFTESPKKLVISPRNRIVTRDSMILNPAIPLADVESAEAMLESSGKNISAYVTPTGGMGAFPTMVIEEASLPWILSTVAHEWVHTYLAFFPLGFNYGIDQENTTINETAADVVGDEVGLLVLERYYPEFIPQQPLSAQDSANADNATSYRPPTFDFRKEMAETRATVDKFLRWGRVADAEHYMEIRRQLFVENGYNLRKLNQAYFAFHGSYGTSPSADITTPDALSPRVKLLRDLAGDPVTFLRTIRSITDRAGLERLIEQWNT